MYTDSCCVFTSSGEKLNILGAPTHPLGETLLMMLKNHRIFATSPLDLHSIVQVAYFSVTNTQVEVSRKRPHPDNEDYLLSPQTFSKRRESSEEGHESGTTAVVCLLRGTQVLVANAGDSRCVMSSNGEWRCAWC